MIGIVKYAFIYCNCKLTYLVKYTPDYTNSIKMLLTITHNHDNVWHFESTVICIIIFIVYNAITLCFAGTIIHNIMKSTKLGWYYFLINLSYYYYVWSPYRVGIKYRGHCCHLINVLCIYAKPKLHSLLNWPVTGCQVLKLA